MSNGKGDTPRPLSVDIKTYKNNWEHIFGNKEDTCEYSGLPSPTSYEASDEYQSAVDRLKRQEELREQLSDINTLGE